MSTVTLLCSHTNTDTCVQVDHNGIPTAHPQGLVPVEWALYHGIWALPSSTRKTYPRLEVPYRRPPDDYMQTTQECRDALACWYEARAGEPAPTEANRTSPSTVNQVSHLVFGLADSTHTTL